MNELELSSNLVQIETEIQFHKENAGKSIWEIGRRLNHVKEHDLTHGEFIKWVESIGITRAYANRYMKVANELNVDTSIHLGVNALYLIATLPDEQKQEQLERIEQGDNPTVRELQELKRINKQQQSEIERLSNQEPKTIVKTVEVKPSDYDSLKAQIQSREVEVSRLSEQLTALKNQQKTIDDNSRKYEELTQAIAEMEGKMNRTQKLIQAQKQVYELVDLSKDLLMKITPIPFLVDKEFVRENDVAVRELENIERQVSKFLSNLKEVLQEKNIIEGEIIHE